MKKNLTHNEQKVGLLRVTVGVCKRGGLEGAVPPM